MKKLYCLTLGVVFSIIGLFVANIMLSAQLSHQGIKLKELEQASTNLKKANDHIELQLVDQTSIATIKDQADIMGFTTKVEYINLSKQMRYALK